MADSVQYEVNHRGFDKSMGLKEVEDFKSMVREDKLTYQEVINLQDFITLRMASIK